MSGRDEELGSLRALVLVAQLREALAAVPVRVVGSAVTAGDVHDGDLDSISTTLEQVLQVAKAESVGRTGL